ncbi:hypothetical protein [Armatimonas rosea]|uniref:Uncharacterized protein n=1 Tax=Armatimonas rosea TaxID=685828 RepID=A0A7W9SUR7_ARMRO|nr:hypothetical protein [Armatimonas rosea]MBB6052735.1 hypothetical protein [Armatimonas rosea]
MTRTERAQRYLETQAINALRLPEGSEPEEGIFRLLPLEAFQLIAVLETGDAPIPPHLLETSLARITQRRDCADFVLVALLRILLRPHAAARLGVSEREAITEAALNFCYWWDQRDASGRGIQGMCFHTENHQILFHCAELLAGQLFPERVFPGTQQIGAWHVAKATERCQRWFSHRRRFGYAEWLSCYFDEDLLALVSLYDFAQDAAIRDEARKHVDFLLSEVARHSFNGVVGVSQGRTYAEFLTGRRHDPLSTLTWLVFGDGEPDLSHPTFAATALATSTYPLPSSQRGTSDQPERVTSGASGERQCRYGVGPGDAEASGIDLDNLDDSLLFWAVQNARHPKLRKTAFALATAAEDTWLQNFIREAEVLDDGEAINTVLGPVDVLTYQTPHYQLSCAQDFRPGGLGYQQHVWQATLSVDAVVFTNQPGGYSQSSAHSERPNFWAGNKWLPRAAQHKNVLICLHRAPADAPLPFSHAYFPRRAFGEVDESGHWVFARLGASYLALYSQHKPSWHGDDELRAEAHENLWLCELGDEAAFGSFTAFCEAVVAATPTHKTPLAVTYPSPSLGQVHFGWSEPLTVNDEELSLHGYPRPEIPQ